MCGIIFLSCALVQTISFSEVDFVGLLAKSKFLLVFFIVSLSLVSTFGFVLKEVRIEGLKTVKVSELEEIYKGYINKDVNEQAIDDIILGIDTIGYFEEVSYELTGDDKAKFLKIKVKENPPIQRLEIVLNGPGLVDKETLRNSISLAEKKAFSFTKFWESIDNLAKLYSDKGYLVATPRSQDKSLASVYVSGTVAGESVKFIITEYVLYKLEFKLISEDEELKKEFERIKKEITLRQYADYERKNWFERIFDSEKSYVPTLKDLQSVVQSLSRYVYFTLINISAEDTNAKFPAKILNLTLVEKTIVSEPLKLKGVKTKDNTVFSESELVGEVREGIYSNFAILKKIQTVKEKYDKAGYFIDLSLEPNPDGYLYIVINEYKVRDVKFEGNNLTKSYVFDDMVYVRPGILLNRNELQLTYVELMKANFFKSIDFDFRPVQNEKSLVDVIIKLGEKDKKFDFQGGITYGPVNDRPWWDGFAGIVELSTTNPTGHGENLSITFQKSILETNINLSTGIRKPFGWPIIFGATIKFDSNKTADGTSTTNLVYSANLSTIKTTLGQLSTELRFEDSTESSSTKLNYKTLVTSASYILETLDNLYVPMNGYSITLTANKYFPLSESGSDAFSYLGEITMHLPILQNLSLASRVLAGQSFQNSGKPVTFSLAGLNQVRGAKPVMGTVIGLLNSEIRYKEKDQMFYGSLFYDIGFASNAYDFANLKQSVGIELGLTVPMFGLIRFGWGIPIQAEIKPNFFFLFGKTF